MTKRANAQGLTDQQMRFAHEYLTDFNASAAYLRAGYKGTPAALANNACRLLAKRAMQQYLQVYRQQVMEATSLTVDRLAKELERIAFSDPRNLFEENGALKNLHTLDEDVARAVSGIELGDKIKITMWDKLGAIEKALKLLNAYPDKRTETPPSATIVGVVVVPAKGIFAPQQREAIESKARRVERVEPAAPKATTFKVPRYSDRSG